MTRIHDMSKHNSNALNSSRSQNDIHERLYKDPIKKLRKSTNQPLQDAQDETLRYVSKDAILRKSPRLSSNGITKKLYEDAFKRKDEKMRSTSRGGDLNKSNS